MGLQRSSASFYSHICCSLGPIPSSCLQTQFPTWEGRNLRDHTPQRSGFHPSCMAGRANTEVWNCNARFFYFFFWGGGNDLRKRDLADTAVMNGMWGVKASMNGSVWDISVWQPALLLEVLPLFPAYITCLGSDQGSELSLNLQYQNRKSVNIPRKYIPRYLSWFRTSSCLSWHRVTIFHGRHLELKLMKDLKDIAEVTSVHHLPVTWIH